MEINPLKCRYSLVAVLLHLRTPALLQVVLGDPDWGSECLGLCWSICKVTMRDLHKADESEVLIMRTFECMSAIWPSVARSMAPGVDADGRIECAVWFSDFLLWGLYSKPAALRRWEDLLGALVAELPDAVQRGCAKLPGSILQRIAPSARKVLNSQHPSSSPGVVERLTRLCEDAAAAVPKKCVCMPSLLYAISYILCASSASPLVLAALTRTLMMLRYSRSSKNSQVAMIDLTGQAAAQPTKQSGGQPARYVKLKPSQRPGLASSSFSVRGAPGAAGGVRLRRTDKKRPVLKTSAPSWQPDQSSSDDSSDESSDDSTGGKTNGRRKAAGRSTRRPAARNMLQVRRPLTSRSICVKAMNVDLATAVHRRWLTRWTQIHCCKNIGQCRRRNRAVRCSRATIECIEPCNCAATYNGIMSGA
jgi:hypothetical protein